MDYVFIIYDSACCTAEQIMDDHNKMHKNIKYILEKGDDQTLNYLDKKKTKNHHRDLSQAYTN
jgi:hypothetical protein